MFHRSDLISLERNVMFCHNDFSCGDFSSTISPSKERQLSRRGSVLLSIFKNIISVIFSDTISLGEELSLVIPSL